MKRTQTIILILSLQWMSAIVVATGFLPFMANAQTVSVQPVGKGESAPVDLSRMGKAELLRNMDEVRRQNPHLYERLRRMPKDAEETSASSDVSTETESKQPQN